MRFSGPAGGIGFGEHAFEIAAVVGAAGGGDDFFKAGPVNEPAVEGDFLDAGDLEVLLVFDGGDVVACFEETGGGTGVEPCDAAAEEARPVRNRMPCPAAVPARLSVRALDVCAIRVEDPNTCVYADMSRGFENDRVGRNTSSNSARCRSDQAEFIGLACWKSDTLDVCSVGCGTSEADAKAQARARCEDKHQQSCRVTAVAPVLVP